MTLDQQINELAFMIGEASRRAKELQAQAKVEIQRGETLCQILRTLNEQKKKGL